jgi:Mn2+/Fe2+ NRAMP family transporter
MNLLHAGPSWLWALIAGVLISAMVIVGSFTHIARVLKFLCLALLTCFGVLFAVRVDWTNVLHHTLLPHLSFAGGYIVLLVAGLGTTISPCLFFWQSAHRLEEMREEPEGGERPVPLKRLGPRARPRAANCGTAGWTSSGGFTVATVLGWAAFALMAGAAITLKIQTLGPLIGHRRAAPRPWHPD